MHEISPNTKVIEQVTGHATDKDGTDVRIVIKIYDNPIFELGEPLMFSSLELNVIADPKGSAKPYYGPITYYPAKLSKENIEEIMQYAKTNVDNFKYPKND